MVAGLVEAVELSGLVTAEVESFTPGDLVPVGAVSGFALGGKNLPVFTAKPFGVPPQTLTPLVSQKVKGIGPTSRFFWFPSAS